MKRLAIVVLAVCIPTGVFAKTDDVYPELETFAEALTLVEEHYVDETATKNLIYGALTGMLSSLDPHSAFLTPKEHQAIKADSRGRFGGIGVEVSIRDGGLTVISPLDGTPAENAGIQPLDHILQIDGQSTRSWTLNQAVEKLRGEPGTEVTLSISRESTKETLEFKIKRDTIRVQSVKYEYLEAESEGYLRLTEFQESTPDDVAKALKELESKGIQGLVLDLRNNPGGLLPEAIRIAEIFVPQSKLIVSTRSRTSSQNIRFVSRGIKERKPYPIVVLVNRGTASSSEIVSGALQDHGLAVLVGAKTFGKASVQTVIPLKDGSALRLTTSRYYTPNGKLIHGQGLNPDVEVKAKDTKPENLRDDPQVMRAVELLKAVSVLKK